MIQLAFSIKQLRGELPSNIFFYCLRVIAIIIILLLIVVYITIDALIWNDSDPDNKKDEVELNLFFIAVLVLTYSVSFVYLCYNVSKLNQDKYSKEIRSVYCQFSLFFIAFLTRSVHYVLELRYTGFIDGFYGAIFESLMAIIWNILPISYILYSNFIVYRKIPKTVASRPSLPHKTPTLEETSSQGQWYKETQLNLMN